MDLGHFKEATVHAEESLSLSHSIGNAFEEAVAMYNLAALHDMAGLWNLSLELLESAISIYDRLRYNVSGDDLRISFFDAMKVQSAYYVYVSRLLHRYWETSEKEWAKKAFLISERRRARALLDVIVEQPDDAPKPTPWAVDDIQSRFLDPGTLLLEYSLHDNESYLFAVEKDAFEVYKLPEGLDIFKQVQRLRQIVNNGSIEDFLEVSSALFQTLLGPVAAKITGKKLLVVPDGCLHFLPFQLLITTGSSNESTLGDDDGKKSALKLLLSMFRKAHRKMAYKDMPFLLKQNLVEYVPSANIIALTHKKSRTVGQKAQNASFYGFAPVHSAGTENGIQDYGALPGTKAEIERIAGLFDKHTAKLYLGEAGTKNAAHICLSSADGYIHFATHGLVDFDEPRYSALMFHPGQTDEYLLHVSEIMKLRLKADLVVLSACETGLGKTRLGEGVIGLARAFLYAGAKNVCASLWKVADRGTEELMYRFYENLISKNMDRSTALQDAQIALLESDTYASPYYWAPFILIGV
jgi:CHAT domain-containing protein